MVIFVPLILLQHKEDFYQMNIETFEWHVEELDSNYNIDTLELLGSTIKELVDNSIDPYYKLKPPEGIVTLLLVNENVAGMLALTKLNETVGEIHRMWIRPKYRGNGYGTPLLLDVLDDGKRLGCSVFKLSTPRFAYAAQHVYRKAGFSDVEEYPESEVAPILRKYWMYMEKRL
jgi:N-acetylglutamate synthase-like GNAT family acetyltransferase